MIANEPETENENSVVEIPVIRRGGSRGVVAVKWEATYKGSLTCHVLTVILYLKLLCFRRDTVQ